MEIHTSYGEALNRCNQSFRAKLIHSVELMKKAERIALLYDKIDGYYLAFSGGKDSQALYHVAQLAGVRFKAHMSLTSVDPPQVIRFVKRQYPDVELVKPKMSMFDKAIEKGILPTRNVRWCCAEFKESAGAGKVTLIGVRAAESARRAKRHEVEVKSRKFSGDLEEFDTWSKNQIEKKMSKTKRKINEDEFSVKTDNEVRCINGKDSILISPIFKWTEADVWYFLNDIVNVPHCELYDAGFTRIGCIFCPMATKSSNEKSIEMFPHIKRGWIRAIKALRSKGFQACETCYNDDTYKSGFIIPPTLRELWGNRIGPDGNKKMLDKQSENEIAETIFEWWMSGKPYKQWYSEKCLQLKLNFNFEQ